MLEKCSFEEARKKSSSATAQQRSGNTPVVYFEAPAPSTSVWKRVTNVEAGPSAPPPPPRGNALIAASYEYVVNDSGMAYEGTDHKRRTTE